MVWVTYRRCRWLENCLRNSRAGSLDDGSQWAGCNDKRSILLVEDMGRERPTGERVIVSIGMSQGMASSNILPEDILGCDPSRFLKVRMRRAW